MVTVDYRPDESDKNDDEEGYRGGGDGLGPHTSTRCEFKNYCHVLHHMSAMMPAVSDMLPH